MASSPTQTHHDSEEPSTSSDSRTKAKFAARNLRIDTHLPYKDDDPATCKLVRGSPVTAIPPVPAKSEKRKKGPNGVPMGSLLAPKSVFTPPLPFRCHKPEWRPPRFHRGSRPHCPEKLCLSGIRRRRYIDKNQRRVYAARGTASLSPQAIPADVPLIRVPAVRVPQATVSGARVPKTEVPPAQVSPAKASPAKATPSVASTEAESVLGAIPFTDPQSPIYSSSGDSLPEIMTRQRKQKKQTTHNEEHCGQIYQAHYARSSVTESPCNQESVVCRREERDECECTLCEDCCLVLAAMGMGMTVLLSVSTAISKVGTWLVSLTPPEEYRRY
ncbi:hypothetical protein NW767_005874 [Fusarium falciforme]|nr:hypothetical protein NW767_005874 [Fusarium falciforme]